MRYAISKIKDELERASIEASQNYRELKQQSAYAKKNVDDASEKVQSYIRALVDRNFILKGNTINIDALSKTFPALAKKVIDMHQHNLSEITKFNNEYTNIGRQLTDYTVHLQIEEQLKKIKESLDTLEKENQMFSNAFTTNRAMELNRLAMEKGWNSKPPGMLLKFIFQDCKEWLDLNEGIKQKGLARNLSAYIEAFISKQNELSEKRQELNLRQKEYDSAKKHLDSLVYAQNTISTNISVTKHNDETLTDYTRNELCKLIIDGIGRNRKYEFISDEERNKIVTSLMKMDVYLNIQDGIKKQFNSSDNIDKSLADSLKKINKSRQSSKQLEFDLETLAFTTQKLKQENKRLLEQSRLLEKQSGIISSYNRSNTTSSVNDSDLGTSWILYYMLYTNLLTSEAQATAAILHNTEAPPVGDILKSIDVEKLPEINVDSLSHISNCALDGINTFEFNDNAFDSLNDTVSNITSTIENTSFDYGSSSSGYSSSDYGSSSSSYSSDSSSSSYSSSDSSCSY